MTPKFHHGDKVIVSNATGGFITRGVVIGVHDSLVGYVYDVRPTDNLNEWHIIPGIEENRLISVTDSAKIAAYLKLDEPESNQNIDDRV